jgi:STAS domain-containing protein
MTRCREGDVQTDRISRRPPFCVLPQPTGLLTSEPRIQDTIPAPVPGVVFPKTASYLPNTFETIPVSPPGEVTARPADPHGGRWHASSGLSVNDHELVRPRHPARSLHSGRMGTTIPRRGTSHPRPEHPQTLTPISHRRPTHGETRVGLTLGRAAPPSRPEVGSAGRVMLDLSRVTFMDSTGIHGVRGLASRAARLKIEFVVILGPRSLRRLFELCQLFQSVAWVEAA